MGITQVPQSNPEKVIPLNSSSAKLDGIVYHDLSLRQNGLRVNKTTRWVLDTEEWANWKWLHFLVPVCFSACFYSRVSYPGSIVCICTL